MLPLTHKITFAIFAVLATIVGLWGFYRLYLGVRRGRADTEERTDRLFQRLFYAIKTSLTQERTFRRRTVLSIFHSFIFYGFVFYLLVNLLDGMEGYIPFHIRSVKPLGAAYNLIADVLSFLVLVAVVAFVLRRFLLPARRDFRFNEKTLLHENVTQGYITRDSAIVAAFIFFHVGSRAIGSGAKLAVEGADSFQPFATFLSQMFTQTNAGPWRIFGYWGALGSAVAFLAYFPYSKHVHIFMAPLKYFFERCKPSGELPPLKLDISAEDPELGARQLEELAWPRLLDAYACIQCNRCKDVCPAATTGKALDPAALEINKRMELNRLAMEQSPFSLKVSAFEAGAPSPHALLEFAISPESVWACTTCGACMQVCPVHNEQMLDIVDLRRNLVMSEGSFPSQLKTAFRGMERCGNPWGIGQAKRMEWAEGLNVPTIDENPEPDVLYWVGCAASYDPGAQKIARAFVQLLDTAGVNYAVLGNKERCTGDTARRAGNEYLFQQLAQDNIGTLDAVRPKLIVTTCPHCMNMLSNEYKQLGGNYKVIHHTQYLEPLLASGKLVADRLDASITYHDPCYLGRHNGVYDAPRAVIRAMDAEILELGRSRENSFCCGAGGAQFWKEEEEGKERVSDNRFKEAQRRLGPNEGEKVLAVGCPFCKSMFSSTPAAGQADGMVVKDIAEVLLEAVERKSGKRPRTPSFAPLESAAIAPAFVEAPKPETAPEPPATVEGGEQPAAQPGDDKHAQPDCAQSQANPAAPRKKWAAKVKSVEMASAPTSPEEPAKAQDNATAQADSASPQPAPATRKVEPEPTRAKWNPKTRSTR